MHYDLRLGARGYRTVSRRIHTSTHRNNSVYNRVSMTSQSRTMKQKQCSVVLFSCRHKRHTGSTWFWSNVARRFVCRIYVPVTSLSFVLIHGSGRSRGNALGALAPPAEPIVKNLNLPLFFSVDHRYLFVCSVCPV